MQDIELQQEDTVSADRKVQIVFDPDAWKKKDKSGRKITSVTSRQNFNNAKYGNRNKQDDDEEEQMKEEKSQIKFVTGNDAIKAGANEVDPKPKTKKIAEAVVKKALKQIAIDKNVGIKDIPFDGPYTKTPADVVDKSGAHHTPYSRVRHLARQAMNKQQVKEEIEQIDELSVHKMLKYSDAAKKDRSKLNAKWSAGTATQKEKNRVIGHEEGEERAANKIKQKTGKYPEKLNVLQKARYAVTKEETELTEWSVKHDGVDADHPNAKLFHGKKDVINHLTKYKDSAEKRAKLLKDKGFKNVRIEESVWDGVTKAYPETKPKDAAKEKQIRANKDAAILDAIRAKKEKEQKAMDEGSDHDPYYDAQENKKSAEAAHKQGDHFAYHLHMSDHHSNMAHWSSNRGRYHVADQHQAKADQHHDWAMQHKNGVRKEEVELQEGKMGQIHADIEDHLGKHLADYKAHGGAEHFGAKTVKTAQHISKLHGIEQKHAQGLVNQYVDSKLKEETEMSDKLTYAQFMEQLLEYTPGPGGVTRVQGRSYGAQYHDPEGDDDADDKPKAEAPKRGRGRPKGSTSGANHKVTSGKKGSGVDYTGFKLHLPNSNR